MADLWSSQRDLGDRDVFERIVDLPNGKPGWERSDKICLAGAALGIVLWYLFDDPVLSIQVNGIVVLIGCWPTWKSIWQDPTRESLLCWSMWCSSSFIAVCLIPALTWQDATQPIVFFSNQLVAVLIILTRPRIMRWQEKMGWV